jgi:hypothetical protein
MTITIDVDGGPTVRLTYPAGPWPRPIVPVTSIMVSGQATAPDPNYLYERLADAAAALALYAAEREHWPADLRPASGEQ